MNIPLKYKKKILFILHNETEIEDAIIEKRLDPNIQRTGGRGTPFISSPTENTAIRNLMPIPFVIIGGTDKLMGFKLYKPEMWLEVIGDTEMVFDGTNHGKVYEVKFHQHKLRDEILAELNISKQYYHSLLNDIINFVYGNAVGRGLMKLEVGGGNQR